MKRVATFTERHAGRRRGDFERSDASLGCVGSIIRHVKRHGRLNPPPKLRVLRVDDLPRSEVARRFEWMDADPRPPSPSKDCASDLPQQGDKPRDPTEIDKIRHRMRSPRLLLTF